MTYFAWPWLVGGVLRLLRLLRETRALSKSAVLETVIQLQKKENILARPGWWHKK